MNSMDKTREFLRSIGQPGGDAYDLPTSEKRFADGGQYRFEVPGIQGPKVMQALLEAIDSYGLYLHRVTQTQGIMRLTDDDTGLLHQQWVSECVRRGVFFTNHHNLFINTAITDDDIAYTVDVAEDAFRALRAAGQKRSI